MNDRIVEKYQSPTKYILSAILPYTEANLKVSFTPKLFFKDLAKLEKHKHQTLQNAYYYCIKRGYIDIDDLTGQPILTPKGLSSLNTYKPTQLKNSILMLIFDIPESERYKRRQLRTLLKQLYFEQAQKSVWVSKYDSRIYLKTEINRLGLQHSVKVFESKELDLKF